MFVFKTSDTVHTIMLDKVCSFSMNKERPTFYVQLVNGHIQVPMEYAEKFIKEISRRVS